MRRNNDCALHAVGLAEAALSSRRKHAHRAQRTCRGADSQI